MTTEVPDQHRPPTPHSRMIALVGGCVYILVTAAILSQTAKVSMVRSLSLVSLGAGVVMSVMVIFGVKAYKRQGPVRQFQLSSLFLLIVPIAIYSTAIRTVLAVLPENIGLLGWFMVTVYSTLFVVLSTAILLWFADALMWIAVVTVRIANHARQSGSET